MTDKEAEKIIQDFQGNGDFSSENDFEYIEAMHYIIDKNHDPADMVVLGAHYYEQRNFELALKYYELASTAGSVIAEENLGYIWYYGRTGQTDYKKAYKYFSDAAEHGSLRSSYKIADMYKNGYYVDRDMQKCKEIILKLRNSEPIVSDDIYGDINESANIFDPYSEIYMRYGHLIEEGIITDDDDYKVDFTGNLTAACEYYVKAREFLYRRIASDPFFGDLSLMSEVTKDIHRTVPYGMSRMLTGLYDLFYFLQKPALFTITLDGKKHEIESVYEDGECVVRCDDKWFHTPMEMFLRAEIDGQRLTHLKGEIYIKMLRQEMDEEDEE